MPLVRSPSARQRLIDLHEVILLPGQSGDRPNFPQPLAARRGSL